MCRSVFGDGLSYSNDQLPRDSIGLAGGIRQVSRAERERWMEGRGCVLTLVNETVHTVASYRRASLVTSCRNRLFVKLGLVTATRNINHGQTRFDAGCQQVARPVNNCYSDAVQPHIISAPAEHGSIHACTKAGKYC